MISVGHLLAFQSLWLIVHSLSCVPLSWPSTTPVTSINASTPTAACARFTALSESALFTTVITSAPNNARFVTCAIEFEVATGREEVLLALAHANQAVNPDYDDFPGINIVGPIRYRPVPAEFRRVGARARFVHIVAAPSFRSMLVQAFQCSVSFDSGLRWPMDRDYHDFHYSVEIGALADIPVELAASVAQPRVLVPNAITLAADVNGTEGAVFAVDVAAGDELWLRFGTRPWLPFNVTGAQIARADTATAGGTRHTGVLVLRQATQSGRVFLRFGSPPVTNSSNAAVVALLSVRAELNRACATDVLAPRNVSLGEFVTGQLCHLNDTNSFRVRISRRAALSISIARTISTDIDEWIDFYFFVNDARNGTMLFESWTSSSARDWSPTHTYYDSLIGTYSSDIVVVVRPVSAMDPIPGPFIFSVMEMDCRIAADPDASCDDNSSCTMDTCNRETGACVNNATLLYDDPCAPPRAQPAQLAQCEALTGSNVTNFKCAAWSQCKRYVGCGVVGCNEVALCCGSVCICPPGLAGADCRAPTEPLANIARDGVEYELRMADIHDRLVGFGTSSLRIVIDNMTILIWVGNLWPLAMSADNQSLALRGLLLPPRLPVHVVAPLDRRLVLRSVTLTNQPNATTSVEHSGLEGWATSFEFNGSTWSEAAAVSRSTWALSVAITSLRGNMAIRSIVIALLKEPVATTTRTTTTTTSTTTAMTTTTKTTPPPTTTTTTGTTATTTSTTRTTVSTTSTTGTTSTTTPTTETSTSSSSATTTATDLTFPSSATNSVVFFANSTSTIAESSASSAMIGIGIGATLFLIAIVLVLLLWRWRKHHQSSQYQLVADRTGNALTTDDDENL